MDRANVRVPHRLAATLPACAGLLVLLLVCACGEEDPPQRPATETGAPAPAPAEVLLGAPHQGRPDEGFVGSAACKSCHVEHYGSWHDSYHRSMTQVATPESVLTSFDGVELSHGGQTFTLRQDGRSFFVRAAQGAERRVVMTTGSHHMQLYWAESGRRDREVYMVPFFYLLADQRWVPREAAFITPPGATYLDVIWNDQCIRCHATGAAPGRPEYGEHFDTRVAELGIACEACHGPGAEHVRHHSEPANAKGPAHAIVNPLSLPVVRQAQICGQCHAITAPSTPELEESWFTDGYPYRAGDDLWKTRAVARHPARTKTPAPRVPPDNFRFDPKALPNYFWNDGMVRVSGREYCGLIESACYQRGEMTCLSCHSMHDSEPNDQLAPTRMGDAACLDCHAAIGADIAAHTHHDPKSSGSRCMNCHMPHTTYGLYKAIRSHEISSPNVQESLPPVGRPNACNLCHLDQSLSWTAKHMETWYGQKAPEIPAPHDTLSAAFTWILRGDAGQRALIAWHMGWPDARKAAGEAWLAPALSIAAAGDPYPAVRYIAARSLRRLPGFEAWSFDFLAPQRERTAAGKAAYALWKGRPTGERGKSPRLGFLPTGGLDFEAIAKLQRTRDDRPVDLAE